MSMINQHYRAVEAVQKTGYVDILNAQATFRKQEAEKIIFFVTKTLMTIPDGLEEETGQTAVSNGLWIADTGSGSQETSEVTQ